MEQMIDTEAPTLYKGKLSSLPTGPQYSGLDPVFRIQGKIFVEIGGAFEVLADGSLGELDVSVKRDTIVEFVDISDQAPLNMAWHFCRNSPIDSLVWKPLPDWAIENT